MVNILKFFISSCESELKNERAIAIHTIKNMGYNIISSENRPASNISIKEEYLNEVRECDIYIGLFGTQYSKPTISEYKEAIKNKKPALIFVKRDQIPPFSDLSEFLQTIRDPSIGRTLKYFEDVVQLGIYLRESIVSLLSREFRRPYFVDNKSSSRGNREYKDIPELGYANIIEFTISDDVKTGSNSKVYARVRGQANYAFLDLLIVGLDNKQYWFPDPNSWDPLVDKGKLTLTENDYFNEWVFYIPKDWNPGYYDVFITVYEDTYYLPTVNRRMISYEKKTIRIE